MEDSYSTLASSMTSEGSDGYFSPIPSPSSSVSSLCAARTHQHRLNAAQEQRTYHDSCQRLTSHIGSLTTICEELKQANKDKFQIYYPIQPPKALVRSQTMTNDYFNTSRFETASQPNDLSESTILNAVRRTSTSTEPTPFNSSSTPLLCNNDLNILQLDLKVGYASADISTLESSSIANLLNDRLDQSLRHLDKLKTRVSDTSSKVLVTGDLNSGKSTFVNALLKREILPADQQPCTSIFCEVLDAMQNDGLEQVHAIPNVEIYNRLDPNTFHIIEKRHLNKVIMDDFEQYKMLKIYSNDARTAQESLLHNGVVDIALIDSPGLNTDSITTTAVFARQEEIDVVVFVVSAENHFTLSVSLYMFRGEQCCIHINNIIL
jgi:mitofusin